MTSNNIQVNGFPFIDILELTIHSAVNVHPTVVLKGHIHQDNASELHQKAAQEAKLVITANDHSGATHTLFNGVLENLETDTVNDVTTIMLSGIGNSALCDIKKEIRVFQNKNMAYKDMVKYLSSCKTAYFILPQAGNDKIGGLLVQYNETDWEYGLRMASRLGTVVVPNDVLDYPAIAIGLPRDGKKYVVSSTDYSTVKDLATYRSLTENGVKGLSEQHMMVVNFRTRDVYKLCDEVVLNGDSRLVYEMRTELVGGELLFTYMLKYEDAFKNKEYFNPAIIGAALKGVVQKVDEDQVQIELDNDVAEYRKWFAYSTPYSSPDGTGWYFMPEVGDGINLCFPTQKENDAYVVSSTHVTHGSRSNPEVKFIRTKRGQAITFSPDSIHITDGNGSSILMDKKKGIEIKTNNAISVKATDNIDMRGSSKVSLTGSQGVDIRNNDSLIRVDSTIDVTAAHVRVQ